MILVVIKMILSGIAALAVLYLLAIMPRMIRRPDTSLFKKVYFAHRGLHDNAGDAPENSMAAFKKAVEAGLGMELDVQVTKDGVPVIFHDFKLERICGAEGKIVNHTYDELQAYTLCQSQERIPKLSELLEMVDGRVPLIVEIKAETADVSCCVIIDKLLHAYRGAYCIESFNPLVLTWYRRYHNDVLRGQLADGFIKSGEFKGFLYVLLQNLLLNWMTKPDFVAYNHKYEKCLSRRLCRKLYHNLAVAWTIRSSSELAQAVDKFDLFIFDSFTPQM